MKATMPPPKGGFDARAEFRKLQEMTDNQSTRRRRYRRSKLDRYKAELIALRKEGASKSQLVLWLRGHRIRVHLSTVSRWVDRNEAL